MRVEAFRSVTGGLNIWFYPPDSSAWLAYLPPGFEKSLGQPDATYNSTPERRIAFDEWWKQYRGVFRVAQMRGHRILTGSVQSGISAGRQESRSS